MNVQNKKHQRTGYVNKGVSCGNLGHLHMIRLWETENKFREEKDGSILKDWLDLNTGSKEREKFAS